MVGVVDAGDDGAGYVVGWGRIIVAETVARFAGFVVDEADVRHFIGEFRFGLFRCIFELWKGLMMCLPMVFEEAVVALEAEFGGGEIAGDEFVGFEFPGCQGGDGRMAHMP